MVRRIVSLGIGCPKEQDNNKIVDKQLRIESEIDSSILKICRNICNQITN